MVCQLELSGKWPDEEEAVEGIKTAFYIHLARAFREQQGGVASPTPHYLDVFKVKKSTIGILVSSVFNPLTILFHSSVPPSLLSLFFLLFSSSFNPFFFPPSCPPSFPPSFPPFLLPLPLSPSLPHRMGMCSDCAFTTTEN